ncbi:c-type cytochrome [Candidatus Neomarinimicrobiota bacterium]
MRRHVMILRDLLRGSVLMAGFVFLLLQAGCRGTPKEKSPIHLIRDMDDQPKYKPQSESHFFSDGITMRTPPEGVVARGDLRQDDGFYLGRRENGSFIRTSPIPQSTESLVRGEQRYAIYCLPCHGAAGDGKGPVRRYAYPIPPTSIHEQRVMDMSDGELFNVISNGIRNMPSYKEQISVSDRWRIVAHVRQLQLVGPRISDETTTQAGE